MKAPLALQSLLRSAAVTQNPASRSGGQQVISHFDAGIIRLFAMNSRAKTSRDVRQHAAASRHPIALRPRRTRVSVHSRCLFHAIAAWS
jgi:hypothetical protein